MPALMRGEGEGFENMKRAGIVPLELVLG